MRDVPPGYDPNQYERPSVTVDVIIFTLRDQDLQVLLVRRKHPPFAGYWAIPGGFVDEGESAEAAAAREAIEETALEVRNLRQFRVYSEPGRDPRQHTASLVFTADCEGVPVGGDDAAEASLFTKESLPADIAFDHAQILAEYFTWRKASKETL